MNRKHLSSGKRGFTLIELMIVVVIIGLLAAISMPNFVRMQTNARIGRTAAELKRLSAAFVAYVAEYGDFPTDSHLTLPAGMEDYINPQIWADETPLGGHYILGRARQLPVRRAGAVSIHRDQRTAHNP